MDNFKSFLSTTFAPIMNAKKRNIVLRYCQSCGLPMPEYTNLFNGTNKNKTHNDEFCFYCLKNGKYTVILTIEQVIDEWIKYTDLFNFHSGTHYTSEELRAILSKRLPRLKRWKQKSETKSIHHQAINKVCRYIDKNLFKELNQDALCKTSNLSKFHFRRIFKSIMGENIGTYIQRLRLEHIAHLLLNSQMTLDEIATSTNYQTKSSLAKAFRKQFGMSTSEYKQYYSEQVSNIERQKEVGLVPDIRKIQEIVTACLPVGDSWKTMESYTLMWNKLLVFTDKQGLINDSRKFIYINLDSTLITPSEQCRSYIGITVPKAANINEKFTEIVIPDGIYAIFRFKGDYMLLQYFYRDIYEEWLLQNGYHQKGTMSFEMCINAPYEVESTELITDIYLPIERDINKNIKN